MLSTGAPGAPPSYNSPVLTPEPSCPYSVIRGRWTFSSLAFVHVACSLEQSSCKDLKQGPDYKLWFFWRGPPTVYMP